MKKLFATKEELDKKVEDILTKAGFYDNLGPFDFPKPDMHMVATALQSEGYDLDDLVADGHGYEIDGHTNNGWLYEDEVGPLLEDDTVLRKRTE